MRREIHWKFQRTEWRPQRLPRLMGILNVTPDSFSDGGAHATLEASVAHAIKLIVDGAD
ncbi:MAG: dihydropteroate synthase, partial [Planctomycetota bacterium]|nr:dihydropteroate synthase [Planctomycetota bacterium]